MTCEVWSQGLCVVTNGKLRLRVWISTIAQSFPSVAWNVARNNSNLFPPREKALIDVIGKSVPVSAGIWSCSLKIYIHTFYLV